MTHTAIQRDAQPFDENQTAEIVHDFRRDGFRIIRNVLQAKEVAALRTARAREHATTHKS